MTTLPQAFPFSRLKLASGEALKWVGYNPTFHRFFIYALAITDAAIYVCSWARFFARWRRYSLSDIHDVRLRGEGGTPAMEFWVGKKRVILSAPFDSHSEDVEFDRAVLRSAVERLQSRG